MCKIMSLARQCSHWGGSQPHRRNQYLKQVCLIHSLQRSTSTLWIFWEELCHLPNNGLTRCSLLSTSKSHSDCHFLWMKYLTLARKSWHGRAPMVTSRYCDMAASWSALSLPFIPIWLRTQQNLMLHPAWRASKTDYRTLCTSLFFEMWSKQIANNTLWESTYNIASEMWCSLMYLTPASTPYNSALKMVALEAIRWALVNASENTAHPTNEAVFEPSVKHSV